MSDKNNILWAFILIVLGVLILGVMSFRGVVVLLRDESPKAPATEKPFTLSESVQVSPEDLTYGSIVTITNGICNKTDQALSIYYSMYLIPQPPQLGAGAIPIIERQLLVLGPKECEGDKFSEPVPREVPAIDDTLIPIPPNTYRLLVRIEGHENNPPEEVLSNFFTITDD